MSIRHRLAADSAVGNLSLTVRGVSLRGTTKLHININQP